MRKTSSILDLASMVSLVGACPKAKVDAASAVVRREQTAATEAAKRAVNNFIFFARKIATFFSDGWKRNKREAIFRRKTGTN